MTAINLAMSILVILGIVGMERAVVKVKHIDSTLRTINTNHFPHILQDIGDMRSCLNEAIQREAERKHQRAHLGVYDRKLGRFV